MPPARRPGSLLALAVLGVLLQRPMHPYEMATVLRDYGKDNSIRIKWGSLYSVVQTLERRGLVAATGTTRQGGRPERTVYEITAAGRQELDEWLRELIAVPEREYPRFEGALSLLGVLPPDDARALLEGRLRRRESEAAVQRAALEIHGRAVPRLFLVENEYHLALVEAELAWVRRLVAELAEGTFPGLDQWHDYHRTGVLPQGFESLSPDPG